MDHHHTTGLTRRRALALGAGAAVGATALGATGSATAQQDAYDGYLAEEPEWDGNTVDASEMDEVEVSVGAGDGLRFRPQAIYVEPGTTIDWVWTGEGGAHNVYHDVDDQIFNSQNEHDGDQIDEAGFTYSFTFEDEHEGAHPYVCTPHRSLQMKGVVVVGEENVETDLVGFGEEDEAGTGPIIAGAAAFSVVTLLGVAAYRELVGDEVE